MPRSPIGNPAMPRRPMLQCLPCRSFPSATGARRKAVEMSGTHIGLRTRACAPRGNAEYRRAPTSPVIEGALLHLVEHFREGLLQAQRLLDLTGRDIGIFAVFEKTGALVFADEFDKRRSIGLPVFRKPFEFFKNGVDAGLGE